MFIPAHLPFIAKSNSENYIQICCFLTKLQRKISWLLFMAHGVFTLQCCFVQNNSGTQPKCRNYL